MKKLVIMALMAVLVCPGLVPAKMRHVDVPYTVEKGVTLWSVAKTYMPLQDKYLDVKDLVLDIQAKNNMVGDNNLRAKWQPGVKIVIPLEVVE